MGVKKTVIITILILALASIGGYFLLKESRQPAALNGQRASQGSETKATNEISLQTEVKVETGQTHELIYTDSGYLPKEITIKVGDTVTWKNESSQGVWTSSAMHPTHMVYSGTSLQEHCPDAANIYFDECKSSQPGESWSFTFNKKGTWGYHNHVNARHFGKIIVE